MVRVTALQKPGGGVPWSRVRRHCSNARTIAQQISPAVQKATSPFQHALATKVEGRVRGPRDSIPCRFGLSGDGVDHWWDQCTRSDFEAAMLDGLSNVRGWRRSVAVRPAVLFPTFGVSLD